MTIAAARPARRPTRRQVSGVVIVVGLFAFIGGVAAAVEDFGPKAESAGTVVGLWEQPSSKAGTTYGVDLTWDGGGQGTFTSLDLYDALNPLASPVAVTIERSSADARIFRVELGETWYGVDPSPTTGVFALVIGLIGLALALWFARALYVTRRAVRPGGLR